MPDTQKQGQILDMKPANLSKNHRPAPWLKFWTMPGLLIVLLIGQAQAQVSGSIIWPIVQPQSNTLTADAYTSDELIIKFKNRLGDTDWQKFRSQIGVAAIDRQDPQRAFHHFFNSSPQGNPMLGWQRVKFSDHTSLRKKLAAVKQNLLVDAAELNPRVHIAVDYPYYTPVAGINDPYYANGRQLYWLHQTQADQALINFGAIGTGPLLLAVIDTGVKFDHEDLQGKLENGYNVLSPGNLPVDDNFHGTFVAGFIVGLPNNAKGIAGIGGMSNIHVLPIKVLDSSGQGTLYDCAIGIIWAVDHGARVINMSLGAAASLQACADACTYADQHGVLVIAAAGNDGHNLDTTPTYPACYSTVLAVSATDASENLAPYSNYGSKIALAAPGGNSAYDLGLVSTYYNTSWQNPYSLASGTSFSSPQVAALAALLFLQNPARTPAMVTLLMENHAENPLGLSAAYVGHGRINVNQTLLAGATATPSRTPSRTRTSSPSITKTSTPTLTMSPSLTSTPSRTSFVTKTSTPRFTPSQTPTRTLSPTYSRTRTPTRTATLSPVLSLTRSLTATVVVSRTPTPIQSPTSIFSPNPTPSATPSYVVSPRASFTPTVRINRTQTPGGRILPDEDSLAVPNPVSGSEVYFIYSLSVPSSIQVELVNVLGQTAAFLEDGPHPIGKNQKTIWKITSAAPGLYWYRMIMRHPDNSEHRTLWKKLVILKH